MRFRRDCSCPGRFFAQGAVVQVVEAGDSALVLPEPGAHATLCRVPAAVLEPVRRFRVRLINRMAGLVSELERWAADEDSLRAELAQQTPDCTLLAVDDSGPG